MSGIAAVDEEDVSERPLCALLEQLAPPKAMVCDDERWR
jgi:hypothetical protein